MRIEETARRAANKVLHDLQNRGGFDAWWDDIDPLTQSAIIDRMQVLIAREIRTAAITPAKPQAKAK